MLKPKQMPIRFAIGDPNSLSSNSWRVWVEKDNELYISCRDNFQETKVSLHASGRWRMGFTSEALKKDPTLIAADSNRAWEVWDQPSETLPNTITAFHLFFVTAELAVTTEQRIGKLWKGVRFFEAAPPGKVTTVTLFITMGDVQLNYEAGPSTLLASFELTENRFAKLIAHFDPPGFLPELIEKSRAYARNTLDEKQIDIPPTAFNYFFGHTDSGARFIVGARMHQNQLSPTPES